MAKRIRVNRPTIHPANDWNYNPAFDNNADIPQSVINNTMVVFSDGVSNGTKTITSAQGLFTAGLVGKPIKLRTGSITAGAIKEFAIAAGGTGYAVNDTGTITGVTGATYKVLAVSGGVVTSLELTNIGTAGTTGVKATATGAPQAGTGTGLTVNVISLHTAVGFDGTVATYSNANTITVSGNVPTATGIDGTITKYHIGLI